MCVYYALCTYVYNYIGYNWHACIYTVSQKVGHTQIIFPHCLWKIKAQICDKLQTSCLMKHTLTQGSADNAIMEFTSCSKCPPFAAHTLEAYTYAVATRRLHRQWRSGPLPIVQQTLLQFVNAVQLRLMHLLLHIAPYLAIDPINPFTANPVKALHFAILV